MAQSAPGEALGTVSPVAVSQSYPQQQYAPYPPYPGPLALPMTPMPGPNPYDNRQQAQPPVQETSPGPMLVQLGASQNFLVDNRPARWIQVLDVDPSYQSARTPSPQRAPGKQYTFHIVSPLLAPIYISSHNLYINNKHRRLLLLSPKHLRPRPRNRSPLLGRFPARPHRPRTHQARRAEVRLHRRREGPGHHGGAGLGDRWRRAETEG